MIETKKLSKNQIRKISASNKSNTSARIHLSYEQIGDKGQCRIILNKTLKEKIDAKKKEEKEVVLEFNSEQIIKGGYLPIILAMLGAVGAAAAGGAAAVANSVISAKHQKAEEEAQRHNIEMEKIDK